ncbi:hypothetical protein GWP57_10320 [Gammaproteobacteria bacterium]|nr:hypothetical protein [Gammaproteobacteria bacterium]
MTLYRPLTCFIVPWLAACAASGPPAAVEEDPIAAGSTQSATASAPDLAPGVSPAAGDAVTSNNAANVEGELPAENPEETPLIDKTQRTVFSVVNGSAHWFDGLFGSSDVSEGENVSRGRVSVGGQWDQRDGFKKRLRLKARVPLTALKERSRLVFGRGDIDDFVDGRANDNIDTLPGRFNDYEDEDWLFGIGYSRDRTIATGWDFGAGIKLATPLEPYIRATYRWGRTYGDSWWWRVRPVVFLQNQRGLGTSVTNILDYAVSSTWLLRSWSILLAEDDVEGLGWTQKFTAYQAVGSKDALSYSVFAAGETENAVKLQDYGVELRYRKRIARDYLYLELSTSLSWPREFLEEVRESNWGVGIELEMQFGDWPGRRQETQP